MDFSRCFGFNRNVVDRIRFLASVWWPTHGLFKGVSISDLHSDWACHCAFLLEFSSAGFIVTFFYSSVLMEDILPTYLCNLIS